MNGLNYLLKPLTRNWIRQYPALVNCTTINWFSEWPREALLEVAEKYLMGVDLGTQENVRPFSHVSPHSLSSLPFPFSICHHPLSYLFSFGLRSRERWPRFLSPCTGQWLSIPRRCCWNWEDTTMWPPPTTWNLCLDIRSMKKSNGCGRPGSLVSFEGNYWNNVVGNIQELDKGTGSRAQVLIWNGRGAIGLNFSQEVNKREKDLSGVWLSLEPSSHFLCLYFWNRVFFFLQP